MSMHLLPAPAEDEFALGYIGRLAHLNLAQSADAFLRALAETFGLPSSPGVRLKTMAQAAGLTATDFLRKHTIAPAIVSGHDVSRGLIDRNLARYYRDILNPLNLHRKSAYFCDDCVTEQRERNGFAYWHREHQLPGVYWCPWHRSPLIKCQDKCITKKQPSWRFDKTEAAAEVRNSIDHPILNRYNEVILGFLRGSSPLDECTLLKLLTDSAKQKGINTWMWPSEHPFLSDIVFDTVPEWWLRDAVPVSEKTAGKFFTDIDDAVCAARVGTQVYALAVALLLDGDPPDVTAARRGTPIVCLD